MNLIDKFCDVFSRVLAEVLRAANFELAIDKTKPTTINVSAILEVLQERDKTKRCATRARLFREASSGWTSDLQQVGHAADCAVCESAALDALRTRSPGLWIVAQAERNVTARPMWWTKAVERHLEEAPARVRLLAGTKEILDALNKNLENGLELAVRSRQATEDSELTKRGIWRSALPEDPLLVTELRDEKTSARNKYVLSASSRNLKKTTERDGLCVRISVFGNKRRVDKTLRLRRAGNLLQAAVLITWEEIVYLDPDVEKGGLPGLALLEPELLDADESGAPADNDVD